MTPSSAVPSTGRAPQAKGAKAAGAVGGLLLCLLMITGTSARAGTAVDDRSLFNLTATWQNQDGRVVRLGDLAGSPLVVAMIYTSCQTICPVTVQQLQKLERTLTTRARGKVRFVLLSLDPAHDTPAKLREFLAQHRITSNRWTLLTGKDDDVRDVAAFLDIKYKRAQDGTIAHTSAVTIFDQGGLRLSGTVDLVGRAQVTADALEQLASH